MLPLVEGGEGLPLVEQFYTLQGEGAWTGAAAWFVRLAGCDVGCAWCDSRDSWDARAFSRVSVDEIIDRLPRKVVGAPKEGCGGAENTSPIVVVTGGEPLMWDLGELTEKLREKGYRRHLETSGSHPLSGEWDWVCLSPKRRRPPLDEAWTRADELKVIIEGERDFEWAEFCAHKLEFSQKTRQLPPRGVGGAEKNNCDHAKFLQPEWSRRNEMTPLIVEYIKARPWWRASLQTHKYMDIP